jgi:rhodanese-related sulfurtransferase
LLYVQKNVVNLWKPIKENQPHVTAVEFKKILDSGKKLILLDVRTADEFNTAHLPGAINIPRGLIEWVTPRTITDTDIPIYAYCRTGARSAFVTDRLTKMGYTNVTNIYDAFKGWVEAGYSVYNRHGEFTLNKGAFEKKEK